MCYFFLRMHGKRKDFTSPSIASSVEVGHHWIALTGTTDPPPQVRLNFQFLFRFAVSWLHRINSTETHPSRQRCASPVFPISASPVGSAGWMTGWLPPTHSSWWKNNNLKGYEGAGKLGPAVRYSAHFLKPLCGAAILYYVIDTAVLFFMCLYVDIFAKWFFARLFTKLNYTERTRICIHYVHNRLINKKKILLINFIFHFVV